ncbi:MAG: histidine phosphatase family protein [Candidatus Omnitrophica bacterium]|nr:histidine phosphatase family protein [Candidatus Omnitrophota bacterium]
MIHKTNYLFIIAACLCAGTFIVSAVAAQAANENKGLDLYYVRHAETVANRTRDYSWPNQENFTIEGNEAREALIEKLAPYRFDHIIVSPAFRARHTILPYLKSKALIAEIWPELNECYWERISLMTALADMRRGNVIIIGEEHTPFFSLRKDGQYLIKSDSAEDGARLVQSAVDRLLKEYSQSGRSILVVGHFFAGRGMIETLLGDNNPIGDISLDNAALTHLRQTPDGSFELLMLNDVPQTRAVQVVAA